MVVASESKLDGLAGSIKYRLGEAWLVAAVEYGFWMSSTEWLADSTANSGGHMVVAPLRFTKTTFKKQKKNL